MAHVSLLLARASLVALAVSIAGAAGPAFANSSGGSGSGGSAPACKPGYVYDANKQTCVKSSSMNDEQLYQQGRDLALAGRYEEALGVLAAVRNQNDSKVLTMVGYSHRKLGRFDKGMAYYQQALAIDPNNADTREYLGEAYVETGRMDLAKAELANVEALCGTECEQYEDLAAAIAGQPDE
jgi:tetratricopeptide (TPR) repeat protein